MIVYSGEVPLCVCGKPTEMRDVYENPLFTGDIVVLFTKEYPNFEPHCHRMSVVVAHELYDVCGDGDGDDSSFVMGIKSISEFLKSDMSNMEDAKWFVVRVKSYKDVIDGEGWKAYGFNYREGDKK